MVTNVQPLLTALRGREFLLNCAIEASIRAQHGDASPASSEEESALHSACYFAAVIIDKEGDLPDETLDEINTQLSLFLESNAPITSDHALTALKATVDDARYWEAPSSHQLIAHDDRLTPQLTKVAENLESNGSLLGWNGQLNTNRQFLIIEDDDASTDIDVAKELEISSKELRKQESRWRRKPASSEWWSTPLATAPSTSADEWNRDRPALLDFQEDTVTPAHIKTVQVEVSEDARVYEIATIDDWVSLCSRYPLEVTRQRNITWAEAFGHQSHWVIPDWSQASADYEAAHLSPFGYLLLSGRVLEVPMNHKAQGDTFTVLAGWSPGETIWLNNAIFPTGDTKNWYFNQQTDSYLPGFGL